MTQLFRIAVAVIMLMCTMPFFPVQFSVLAADSQIFSATQRLWIAEHPQVRIRISRAYPPFEFFSEQQYQGLAYDYLQNISKQTGLEFIPVEGLTWEESLQALRSRSGLDMVLLMTPTSERQSYLAFTRAYLTFDSVLITTRDNAEIDGFHSLAGKTVAVEAGYITEQWLRRDLPEVKILPVASTVTALQAVSQGRADAYVGNLAVGFWIIEQQGLTNLKVAGETPYGDDAMAMAVRSDWPELVDILNTALEAIPDSIHQQIRNRWIPVRYEQDPKVPELLLWMGGVLLAVLLWNIQLRTMVKRRTLALRQEIDLRKEQEVELKMSMDYLKNTHQRLRFNIDRMPLGYIVWDADFAVSEWNPAAEKIFGWSKEDARGKHAYDLVVPESAREVVDQVWADLMQGDDASSSVNENVTRDGRRLICSWSNTPLRNADDEVSGALSMVEDITRRYEEEESRKQQFEQLSKIFDSLNAMVYVADFETYELLYLNRFGQKLFGNDWEGKKCYEFLQSGQTEICRFCTNDRLVVDGEPAPPYIWEFQNTVNYRWYQCIDRAILWLNGKLARIEIAFDITESKEIETMKEELVSSVSHEMRTPLTAVLGYAEHMMTNQVDPASAQEYITTIYHEAEKLSDLIDSFLNLQQLKAGQQPLSFFAVDICGLLHELRAEHSRPDKRHEIVVDCPEHLARVKGDKVQIREAVNRVVLNAIKYSPAGGRITLRARRSGPMIEISVADQGVGIPAVALTRIFDRFYRVDNTDRRQFGGVGIGLSLVHDIVTTHDGQVRAQSDEGEGTTITLSFPVYE